MSLVTSSWARVYLYSVFLGIYFASFLYLCKGLLSERRKLWAAAAQCGTHRRLGRSADSVAAARLRLTRSSQLRLLRRQFAETRRPARSQFSSVQKHSCCSEYIFEEEEKGRKELFEYCFKPRDVKQKEITADQNCI